MLRLSRLIGPSPLSVTGAVRHDGLRRARPAGAIAFLRKTPRDNDLEPGIPPRCVRRRAGREAGSARRGPPAPRESDQAEAGAYRAEGTECFIEVGAGVGG